MNEKVYRDEDDYWHLMHNIDGVDVDLLEGKKATWCYSYSNGDYKWKDVDKDWHLMRNIDGVWVDLLEGKKAVACHSYANGDYKWKDEDGKQHKIKGEKIMAKKLYKYEDGKRYLSCEMAVIDLIVFSIITLALWHYEGIQIAFLFLVFIIMWALLFISHLISELIQVLAQEK